VIKNTFLALAAICLALFASTVSLVIFDQVGIDKGLFNVLAFITALGFLFLFLYLFLNIEGASE
jgi:hypothetical protein